MTQNNHILSNCHILIVSPMTQDFKPKIKLHNALKQVNCFGFSLAIEHSKLMLKCEVHISTVDPQIGLYPFQSSSEKLVHSAF
jgi:hypothetical protein